MRVSSAGISALYALRACESWLLAANASSRCLPFLQEADRLRPYGQSMDVLRLLSRSKPLNDSTASTVRLVASGSCSQARLHVRRFPFPAASGLRQFCGPAPDPRLCRACDRILSRTLCERARAPRRPHLSGLYSRAQRWISEIVTAVSRSQQAVMAGLALRSRRFVPFMALSHQTR